MSRLAQYRQAERENHTTKSTKHEEQEEDDGLNAETAEHAEMRARQRPAEPAATKRKAARKRKHSVAEWFVFASRFSFRGPRSGLSRAQSFSCLSWFRGYRDCRTTIGPGSWFDKLTI